MPTYANFTALVRDWSNKDSSVLSDTRIQDCLRYAADKCYRNLRVAALENTITYNSTALEAATTAANTFLPSQTDLTLPTDLIEFIQIREIDSAGRTCRVFNEKTDLRTFNDWSALKTSYIGYFSRQGNTLLLAPGFGQANSLSTADKIELHYYRRLPALNALYDVTPANYAAGFLTQDNAAAVSLFFVNGDTNTAYATQAEATTAAGGNQGNTNNAKYKGNEAANWLRDENERVLLMGALAEVFYYLQDDDQGVKYKKLFDQEIFELNDEDSKRNAAGGNVQVNFSGRGLI
jgi:hypothetical protein|tara:strand:- start:99 stop:974 length:876 start_codon:yes stop_codon:yes gene_type:complete